MVSVKRKILISGGKSVTIPMVYRAIRPIVRGSGNVYRDFEYPDADVRQAKAIMGAQIIKILDKEALSTRQAEAKTGISHSEFSRIRQAKFVRFTIDRLMTILCRLGQRVEISVDVHPRRKHKSAAESTMHA